MINLIKLTKDTYPEFNKYVLLVEQTKDKTYIAVGYLDSIKKEGFQYVTEPYIDLDSLSKIRTYRIFKPTHFAELDLKFPE